MRSFLLQIRGSRSRALPDRALVNCQYSSATFSTGERKRRPHGDRKSCEMGLQLRQTFEAAILTQLHPRSQIDIYVQVSYLQPHPPPPTPRTRGGAQRYEVG